MRLMVQRCRWLASWLFGVVLTILPAPRARAEPGPPSSGPPSTELSRDYSAAENGWRGLSEFLRIARDRLGQDRVKLVGELDYDALEPRDAIIVLHPEVKLDGSALTAFLTSGGRLAVFDDFGAAPRFLETFGITRVPAPLTPLFSLRGDRHLAVARPIEPEGQGPSALHPLASGLTEIVTNHPAALAHPNLTPVLGIESNDGSVSPILVTGVIAGRGRLVAGSDPSIFINLMLRYPGNRRLVLNLLDYLTDREPTEREPTEREPAPSRPPGRVFLVSGTFSQTGGQKRPTDPVSALFERVEELVQAARDGVRNGIPDPAWLFLATILSVLFLAREFWLSSSATPPVLPRFARPTPLLAQAGTLARVELLGAETTTPLLALAEMEAALTESLAARLGISPSASRTELQAALEGCGIGRPQAREFADTLSELRALGRALAAPGRWRPGGARLRGLEERSLRMLVAIQKAGASK